MSSSAAEEFLDTNCFFNYNAKLSSRSAGSPWKQTALTKRPRQTYQLMGLIARTTITSIEFFGEHS